MIGVLIKLALKDMAKVRQYMKLEDVKAMRESGTVTNHMVEDLRDIGMEIIMRASFIMVRRMAKVH